jgi:cobalt-zinc-cadmium efflux system membrane fusion protein
VIDANGQARQTVPDLPLLYVAGKVEPDPRAFLFYVQLPNKLIRNRQTPDGHRFSAWQFKPGQRVELLVPVERWADRIVLPISAVVQDGAESYVFEKNDGHFDRRAVRVEYRDQYSAVVANDGILTPGKMVIVSGSYQVHLAMKNKAGGAPDPHAGHNH